MDDDDNEDGDDESFGIPTGMRPIPLRTVNTPQPGDKCEAGMRLVGIHAEPMGDGKFSIETTWERI